MSTLRRSPALRAILTTVIVSVVIVALLMIGLMAQIRQNLESRSAELRTAVQALPVLPENADKAATDRWVASANLPIRVQDATGRGISQAGEPALWVDTSTPMITRFALVGSGVRTSDGVIEVAVPRNGGGLVRARANVGHAAMTVSGQRWIQMILVGLAGGLIAALLGAWSGRRRRREVAALTTAAECLISGRTPDSPPHLPAGSDLTRARDAIVHGATRIEHLGEVADRELGLLTAAIEPLPIGVAGRGPAGGLLRNVALERMTENLGPADRAVLENTLRQALEANDPVGGRVNLSDGRLLDVDAWTVPGGRLVSVAERTEQERLATFRRQIEGSAVRQLRAPIDELKARGKELYQQIPAPAAPTLRAMLAATDRLDRVARMMLRGTAQDPAQSPARRESFGVAGFLWGLAHDWDAALRQRALRVELDIAADLPDVRTDPALVQEILTELIDNAAKFTPRGGTVKLGARTENRHLVLDVRDSGEGLRPQDAAHATERFFRGYLSESIPGAGLGLGVAAALAERLGGSLEVQPGPGGHVRLLVPLANGALQAA